MLQLYWCLQKKTLTKTRYLIDENTFGCSWIALTIIHRLHFISFMS